MHRLILMRHAKTEARSVSGDDHDRALTSGGQADAALMGRVLASAGYRPDLVLVSDAVRTRQTWDAMDEAFGDLEMRIEPRLYEATVAGLRDVIEAARDDAGCLMVVAHNPAVHALASRYVTEAAAAPPVLDRLAGGFSTGAAAVFTVERSGRFGLEAMHTPAAHGGGGDE